jgi:hypothetical protein
MVPPPGGRGHHRVRPPIHHVRPPPRSGCGASDDRGGVGRQRDRVVRRVGGARGGHDLVGRLEGHRDRRRPEVRHHRERPPLDRDRRRRGARGRDGQRRVAQRRVGPAQIEEGPVPPQGLGVLAPGSLVPVEPGPVERGRVARIGHDVGVPAGRGELRGPSPAHRVGQLVVGVVGEVGERRGGGPLLALEEQRGEGAREQQRGTDALPGG